MIEGRIYMGLFDEVYSGPLFISDKILLSHEPVFGLSWCLNIHGHDHSNMEKYADGCKHLNVAANVCDYTPVNLGQLIKDTIGYRYAWKAINKCWWKILIDEQMF